MEVCGRDHPSLSAATLDLFSTQVALPQLAEVASAGEEEEAKEKIELVKVGLFVRDCNTQRESEWTSHDTQTTLCLQCQ